MAFPGPDDAKPSSCLAMYSAAGRLASDPVCLGALPFTLSSVSPPFVSALPGDEVEEYVRVEMSLSAGAWQPCLPSLSCAAALLCSRCSRSPESHLSCSSWSPPSFAPCYRDICSLKAASLTSGTDGWSENGFFAASAGCAVDSGRSIGTASPENGCPPAPDAPVLHEPDVPLSAYLVPMGRAEYICLQQKCVCGGFKGLRRGRKGGRITNLSTIAMVSHTYNPSQPLRCKMRQPLTIMVCIGPATQA